MTNDTLQYLLRNHSGPLIPQDKVDLVRKLLKEAQEKGVSF